MSTLTNKGEVKTAYRCRILMKENPNVVLDSACLSMAIGHAWVLTLVLAHKYDSISTSEEKKSLPGLLLLSTLIWVICQIL